MNTMTWIIISTAIIILVLGILSIVWYSKSDSKKTVYMGAQSSQSSQSAEPTNNDYEPIPTPIIPQSDEIIEEAQEVDESDIISEEYAAVENQQGFHSVTKGYATIGTSYNIPQMPGQENKNSELQFNFTHRDPHGNGDEDEEYDERPVRREEHDNGDYDEL